MRSRNETKRNGTNDHDRTNEGKSEQAQRNEPNRKRRRNEMQRNVTQWMQKETLWIQSATQ